MTAYNREAFIAQAMESVLGSSMNDFELIVVDDASTDSTFQTASAIAKRDSRVRLFRNDANLGDYPNRNRAAGYATGKYLKYLDSDDVIYPYGLEVMCRCIEAFPDACLAISAVPDSATPYPVRLSPREAYLEHFGGLDTFARAPGSTIVRKSDFDAAGGFSGRRQVGDHELWLKLARRKPVVKMPSDLVWDRKVDGQEKSSATDAQRAVMHDEVRVAALMADDCPLTESERHEALSVIENHRARYFWTLIRNGSGVGAAQYYRKALNIPATTIAKVAMRRARSAGFAVGQTWARPS